MCNKVLHVHALSVLRVCSSEVIFVRIGTKVYLSFVVMNSDESGTYDSRSAILENREFKKWKFSFYCKRHALSTSFDIYL